MLFLLYGLNSSRTRLSSQEQNIAILRIPCLTQITFRHFGLGRTGFLFREDPKDECCTPLLIQKHQMSKTSIAMPATIPSKTRVHRISLELPSRRLGMFVCGEEMFSWWYLWRHHLSQRWLSSSCRMRTKKTFLLRYVAQGARFF